MATTNNGLDLEVGSLGGAVSQGVIDRSNSVSTTVQNNVSNPTVPDAATVTSTDIVANDNEFADPTASEFMVDSIITPEATTGTTTATSTPEDIETSTYTAVQAGQGAVGEAAQGTLTDGSLAEAAQGTAVTAELDVDALVSTQMEELTKGLESGDIPTWAQPSVAAAEAQLAARGITRSSVGQAALSNAIIQSALPIAQANAQALQERDTLNLTNQQNTNLTNLANQQQVNIANASAETQMVIANLNAAQQTAMQNLSNQQDVLLSDQAAANAAAQFNATSENQTAQFMSSLKAQVEEQNASRADAMTQFNAGQVNAMEQFNANTQFQADKFNAGNATVISQSNLTWRRSINTANTEAENAANMVNAQNAYELSSTALNNMWQEMRDTADWAYTAAQNDKQVASALAIATMETEARENAQSSSNKSSNYAALGAAAVTLIDKFW